MCAVLWDRRGVLLIDFITQGTTINADVYCETVSKLRRAIQNKRRGLLSSGVLLLHDKATTTHCCSNNCSGKSSNTHPIALTLHPVTFILVAEQFSSDDEVKTAMQHWVKTLAADFFEGIEKLVPWAIWVVIISRSS
jgi:hypothetical protein